MHLASSKSYQSSKVFWLTYKINKKKNWTPASLSLTLASLVCVSVCLSHTKSHPKVSLFSPRAAWCNKILICPWLTMVLFCAEMHREWLVYPQYPWQMAVLLCLWNGMGVAVHVCVRWRCSGQVSLTPLSRPCLQLVCAHFDVDQLSSVSAPFQNFGPTTKNLFAVMFPFIAFPVCSAPTVVSPHIQLCS